MTIEDEIGLLCREIYWLLRRKTYYDQDTDLPLEDLKRLEFLISVYFQEKDNED